MASAALSAIKLAKRQLRREVNAALKTMPLEQIRAENEAMQKRVLESAVYKRSKHVAVYLALEREADTAIIIADLLKSGSDKVCYVPQVAQDLKSMRMLQVTSMADFDTFDSASFGIKQPSFASTPHRRDALHSGTLDLVITPGVAFNTEGLRCGHGAGLYDRFFAECKQVFVGQGKPMPYAMALALSVQMRDEIPCTEFDHKVDEVVHV